MALFYVPDRRTASMDGFRIHYFTRRVGHDTDDLYAYFPDGTLMRQGVSGQTWHVVPSPTHPREQAQPEARRDD